MARKAIRDTYGVEMVGGVEVRRLVKAGDPVPSTYTVPDGDVEGGSGAATAAGNDATAPPNPGVGDVNDLKGQDLEDAIDAAGGYEALGLKADAKADEKRVALSSGGTTPPGSAVGE